MHLRVEPARICSDDFRGGVGQVPFERALAHRLEVDELRLAAHDEHVGAVG
jgi:hypothetical protein